MKNTGVMILLVCLTVAVRAQTIDLSKLSAFRQPGASWKEAGNVRADLSADNVLIADAGTGILVNTSSEQKHGTDLFSNAEHGDADIEFDYLLARGANSGVYLQGRYEVQLFDSWGKATAASYDNGGIYERWDDSKPDGQKGFEGIAARQNVSRAPGTWQHMKISFVAPRFDAGGKKIANARITKVELNGVVIHDNVELSGVTRGAAGAEQAKGPVRIQGDHGSVAIRNFKIIPFDKTRPELTDIRYSIYRGIYKKEPDYKSVSPEAQGSLSSLTAGITNLPDTFLLRYAGTLRVKEAGEYRFRVNALAGKGTLRINNKVVAALTEESKDATVSLPAGDLPFELLYNKVTSWGKPAFTISVSGPAIREYLLSDEDDVAADNTDPILVDGSSTKLLRSFMDIPGKRVIHAVSVSGDGNVHYTYDMDRGAIVQVWRGGFLDATPMWHERGDGSSRPIGTVQLLGDPQPALCRLNSPQATWIKDTINTGFRVKGYKLNENERPVFRYAMYGAQVTDAIHVAEKGTGITREINVKQAPGDLFVRLAADSQITEVGKGMYVVGDHRYYVQVGDSESASPQIRESNGMKELIVPVKSKIVYSILF